MSIAMLYTVGVLVVAAIAFASGRIRLDLVALLVVLSLLLGGILTPREALAGFGDPVVLLVAGLLVVGEGLARTGVAAGIGNLILRFGGTREIPLTILIMLAAALLGSVMSSTAVVAIFIPIVLVIAKRTGVRSNRLLLPLSYAALVSGMMTLVATTPNVIASEELRSRGYEPLGFFSFTPIGIAILVGVMLVMVTIGRRLLPDSRDDGGSAAHSGMEDLWADFGLGNTLHRLRVDPGSPLIGKTLAQARLAQEAGVRVLAIERTGSRRRTVLSYPTADAEIRRDDVLVSFADADVAVSAAGSFGLTPLAFDGHHRQQLRQELGLAVVLVHPEAGLIGRSIAESQLRTRLSLHALALKRGGEVRRPLHDLALQGGDALLVAGPWNRLATLSQTQRDLVVATLPEEITSVPPSPGRAGVMIAILALMVILSASGWMPVVTAVLIAAMATILTKCVPLPDVYRSMHWSTLILIAGLLPLATALDQTGAIDLAVASTSDFVAALGPRGALILIFLVTVGLGSFLSNTVTAVLMAPVAIALAEAMGITPHAFAMTVAIAASAAYLTPVSSPIVTLVVEPGRYGFFDFVRMGIPTLIVSLIIAAIVIPMLFPFTAVT